MTIESMNERHFPQSCAEWEARLAHTPEEPLSSDEREALRVHTASCANCSELLRDYRLIDSYIHWSRAIQPQQELPPWLIAEMQRNPIGSHRTAERYVIRRFWIPALFTLLAIGVAVGIGLYVAHSRHPYALVIAILALAEAGGILAVLTPLLQFWRVHFSENKQHAHSHTALPERIGQLCKTIIGSVSVFRHGRTSALISSAENARRRNPSGQRFRRIVRERAILLLSCLLLLVANAFSLFLLINPIFAQAGSSANNINIGISDGNPAFDTGRPDGQLKLQAAHEFAAGHIQTARRLWQQAIAIDSSDAEAQIYYEDLQVMDSHHPYITLVVATILSPQYIGGGRDDLQGAYIAQQEINHYHLLPGGLMLRLLVAVSGFDSTTPVTVARQIVQVAQRDATIAGVIGWPTSSATKAVSSILTEAHLPMISPTASSIQLTNISPYFFRVAPTDAQQAEVAAQYAKHTLQSKNVVVFYDPADSYSDSLATSFIQNFQDSGHTVTTEKYTRGNPESLLGPVQDALQVKPGKPAPDLFYFAGYVSDMDEILKHLPACARPSTLSSSSCILVMGGDALYVQGDYDLGNLALEKLASYSRLRFTAFAFPSQCESEHNPQHPSFCSEYAQSFDPNGLYQPGTYGYNLPDADAMLSYEATQAFLQASATLLEADQPLTADNLRAVLIHTTIQAIGETFTFEPNGNVGGGQQVYILSGNTNEQTSVVSRIALSSLP